MWQQLELASKIKPEILDTVVWGKKLLVDFNAGKIQLVLFDLSYNSDAVDVKMDGFVLEENHILRCWNCLSLINWIGSSFIVSNARNTSKKIGKLLAPGVALYLHKSTI